MKFLIVTKTLQNLRLVQRLIEEKTESPILFLEWDTSKAGEILQHQDIDILICETAVGMDEYVDFLANLCAQEKRPEIIALFNNPDQTLLDSLEELPGILFLKTPFDEERAEKILRLTMKRVEQKQYCKSLEKHHQYWESHRSLIQQQFWMRFCSGQISLNPSDFIKEAENCGIQMRLSDTYQIGVLSRKLIRERNAEIERKTRDILLDFANRWFRKQGADYIILDQLRPLLIIRNMPKEEFLYQCKGLIREIMQEENMPLCIYYDADIFCENIFSSVLYVMGAEKEDLEEEAGVYPAVQSMVRKKEDIDVLIPSYTEEYLRNGHYGQVIQNLRSLLQEQTMKGKISGSYLRAMRLDMSQLIYSVLKEKKILAHKVMMRADLKELEANAHISIDSFLGWIEEVFSHMPENKTSASATEAVQNYVKDHIREEISREMIAEALYMNADYLGRLYKRETGQSLGSYIMEEKMKEACRMLTSTTKSIGEIGTELGYGNFSHFSKIFKKITGCTSKEYRSLYITKKSDKNET